MTFAPALAVRLRRPEAARGRGMAGTAYPPNSVGITSGYSTGRGQTAGVRASFGVDTGTISATLLAAIVVGVGLFYVWTRGHQA